MLRADYRNMDDDETQIAKGYRSGTLVAGILLCLPGLGLYLGDEKTAFYFGFMAVILLLNEMVNRLNDLAIRLSRTNELLVDGNDERRYRKTK
jgi:hypothetical protein